MLAIFYHDGVFYQVLQRRDCIEVRLQAEAGDFFECTRHEDYSDALQFHKLDESMIIWQAAA